MTISAAVGTWPAGGWNSIRLRIEDDTGAVRTIDFNLFSNRALLDVGLSGLAFHASVQRRPIRSGIAYSDDFLVSGFCGAA